MKSSLVSSLVAIAVTLCSAAVGDTVVITPSSPTAKDSITFRLFDIDICCCAGIHDDTVAVVQDTAIVLGFSVDTAPCMLCNCFAPGMWIEFKSAPLTAGTYAIYRAKTPWCNPDLDVVCLPLIEYDRVGEVTVHGSTGVVRNPAPVKSRPAGPDVRWIPHSNSIAVTFDAPTEASVELFRTNGTRHVLCSTRHFPAGAGVLGMAGSLDAAQVSVVRIRTPQHTFTRVVADEN